MDTRSKALCDKLLPWWRTLSAGGIISIHRDGSYRHLMSTKKTRNAQVRENIDTHTEQGDEPDVKIIVWSAMSVDVLEGFTKHIMHRCTKGEIEKIMRSADPMDVFAMHPRKFFVKYQAFTRKDVTLKQWVLPTEPR